MATSLQTILVVDDHSDSRLLIKTMLAPGFHIHEAANGEQALQLAAACRPDLILMNLSMPVMDGWEATRRLKTDAHLQHIPVIAISSHVLPDEATKAQAAGCVDFLRKPVTQSHLRNKINHWLKPTD